MAIAKKLKKYLDNQRVKYTVLHHPEAYTAQEIAGSQHVPGRNVLKSVVLNVDGQFILCVLPAIHMIDFKQLKKETKAKNVALVSEEELSELFPEFEIGAEPPLKDLCGLTMWMDGELRDNQEVAFNAGTHTDMVKMSFTDYWKVAKPDKVGKFCKHI